MSVEFNHTIAELSAAIGKTQGELRAVHLKYHLHW
jgi:hypothetical protein